MIQDPTLEDAVAACTPTGGGGPRRDPPPAIVWVTDDNRYFAEYKGPFLHRLDEQRYRPGNVKPDDICIWFEVRSAM
jgi:hypothetical protein